MIGLVKYIIFVNLLSIDGFVESNVTTSILTPRIPELLYSFQLSNIRLERIVRIDGNFLIGDEVY